jgi:hypothetical protein
MALPRLHPLTAVRTDAPNAPACPGWTAVALAAAVSHGYRCKNRPA